MFVCITLFGLKVSLFHHASVEATSLSGCRGGGGSRACPSLAELPSPHNIYTSFENGSFLKIHLDYQTLKVTSPALRVWLGGWLQTAEQCSRLSINAWMACAGKRGKPALCSLLQPIIILCVCLFSQQGKI